MTHMHFALLTQETFLNSNDVIMDVMMKRVEWNKNIYKKTPMKLEITEM